MLLVYLARLVLVADVRNVAAQSRTCSHIAYIQTRSPGDWNAAGNRLANDHLFMNRSDNAMRRAASRAKNSSES